MAFVPNGSRIAQDSLAGIVAFRSTKVRTFAERKATLIVGQRLSKRRRRWLRVKRAPVCRIQSAAFSRRQLDTNLPIPLKSSNRSNCSGTPEEPGKPLARSELDVAFSADRC
jgi:hypothetical protein